MFPVLLINRKTVAAKKFANPTNPQEKYIIEEMFTKGNKKFKLINREMKSQKD